MWLVDSARYLHWRLSIYPWTDGHHLGGRCFYALTSIGLSPHCCVGTGLLESAHSLLTVTPWTRNKTYWYFSSHTKSFATSESGTRGSCIKTSSLWHHFLWALLIFWNFSDPKPTLSQYVSSSWNQGAASVQPSYFLALFPFNSVYWTLLDFHKSNTYLVKMFLPVGIRELPRCSQAVKLHPLGHRHWHWIGYRRFPPFQSGCNRLWKGHWHWNWICHRWFPPFQGECIQTRTPNYF